jgi:hypothetical protein
VQSFTSGDPTCPTLGVSAEADLISLGRVDPLKTNFDRADSQRVAVNDPCTPDKSAACASEQDNKTANAMASSLIICSLETENPFGLQHVRSRTLRPRSVQSHHGLPPFESLRRLFRSSRAVQGVTDKKVGTVNKWCKSLTLCRKSSPRRAKAVSWHFAMGIKALSLEFKSGFDIAKVHRCTSEGKNDVFDPSATLAAPANCCPKPLPVKGFLAQRMGRIALREMLGCKVTLLKVGLVIF